MELYTILAEEGVGSLASFAQVYVYEIFFSLLKGAVVFHFHYYVAFC